MGTISLTTIADGSLAVASTVRGNFTTIQNVINGNIEAANIAADAIGASEHADISADTTNTYHSGQGIKISNGSLTATNVQTAIAEIVTETGIASGDATKTLKYYGYDAHASDYSQVSIAVPANTAATLIKVSFSADMHVTPAIGSVAWSKLSLALNGIALSQAGSEDARFHLRAEQGPSSGADAAYIIFHVTVNAILTTAVLASNPHVTSIDYAAINTISLAAPFYSGATGDVTNMSMIIEYV